MPARAEQGRAGCGRAEEGRGGPRRVEEGGTERRRSPNWPKGSSRGVDSKVSRPKEEKRHLNQDHMVKWRKNAKRRENAENAKNVMAKERQAKNVEKT